MLTEIVRFVVNLLNIYASFRGGVRTKIHLKILLRVKIRRKIFLSASNLKSSNVIGQIDNLTNHTDSFADNNNIILDIFNELYI